MPEGSRRDVFRWLGAASAVSLGGPVMAQTAKRAVPENLTPEEADILEAFCARLVPSDGHGPGAAEAHAAHYIDRALGSALATLRGDYRNGLMSLDAYAQKVRGKNFAALAPDAQDAVLTDLEKNVVPGFSSGSAAFFTLVRNHTLQGMFSDPYYGGNDGFLGWTLMGYPGIRLAVSRNDQAMNARLTPVLKSAYDFPTFYKAADDKPIARPMQVTPQQMPKGADIGGVPGKEGAPHDH